MTRSVLAWSPWLAAGIYGLLMAVPATRKLAFELQRENGPVELATFAALALAGLCAAAAAMRARGPGPARPLLVLAAVVLLFVAGEEVAWGQHFLGEPLSESWAQSNRQGETTIHNLPALQGKSELSYLLAAVVALLMRRPGLERRLGPARVGEGLVPGLLLIVAYALAEIVTTLVSAPHLVQEGMRNLAEVIEMVVGGVALAWAWSAWRRTAAPADA